MKKALQFVDRFGKVRAYFPANKSGQGPQSFTSEFEIMRGDLVRLLHDAVNGEVEYRFGLRVIRVDQGNNVVNVSFSDNTQSEFDLVVGADGQNSKMRRLMLGPEMPDPIRYLGRWIAYFTLPWPVAEGEDYRASVYMAPGNRSMMVRRSNPHEVQVYFGCEPTHEQAAQVSRNDVGAVMKLFAEYYAGAGWKTDDIVAGMRDADGFYCERAGVVKMEKWSWGAIVLLGDAADSPTVNTGMGTTSSFVGAYILAGEIEKQCRRGELTEEIGHALQNYKKIFGPFMEQVQRGVAETDGGWWGSLFGGAWAIALLHWFLALTAWLKLDVLSLFVLREDIRNWELPEYPEMAALAEYWGTRL